MEERSFLQQWGPPVFLVVMIGIMGILLWRTLAGSSAATVTRASSVMSTYETVTQLVPLGCPTGDDTRLCDYYLASSSYSVFPSSYVYDYISDGILPLVIKAGARLVELDVYADENGKPVVGLKNETLGYDYAKNSVSFESCCVSIANTAFNKVETKTASDPFVLSLMFHTTKRDVMEACAEILKQTLGRYFLSPEYAYEGQGTKNLATEPICNLAGKLIIVSGPEVKSVPILHELVNLSWGSSNLRRLSFMNASQPYDHEELIDSNRKAITMVIPDADPDLKNSNPTILFGYGCQWIMMNYGSLDAMMEIYIGKFQQGSVLLKPKYLRYTPLTYKTPALPPPEHSFQPMAASSPIYDHNPKTGDKSIVF
jgi:hypothetical protein